MKSLLHDAAGSLRSLARQPLVAVAAALTLAVGLAAASSVFALVRGVLLEPLPFSQPERLVRLFATLDSLHGSPNPRLAAIWNRLPLSWLDAADLRRAGRSFSGLGLYEGTRAVLEGGRESEEVSARASWPPWPRGFGRRFSRGSGRGSGRILGRRLSSGGLLVIAEVALTMTLTASAALLVASWVWLSTVDRGFNARGVLVQEVHLPDWRYPTPAGRGRVGARILEKLRALPGVRGPPCRWSPPGTSGSWAFPSSPASPSSPAGRSAASGRATRARRAGSSWSTGAWPSTTGPAAPRWAPG